LPASGKSTNLRLQLREWLYPAAIKGSHGLFLARPTPPDAASGMFAAKASSESVPSGIPNE